MLVLTIPSRLCMFNKKRFNVSGWYILAVNFILFEKISYVLHPKRMKFFALSNILANLQTIITQTLAFLKNSL